MELNPEFEYRVIFLLVAIVVAIITLAICMEFIALIFPDKRMSDLRRENRELKKRVKELDG
jgi:uncharacterized membrane protein (DUF106 family)